MIMELCVVHWHKERFAKRAIRDIFCFKIYTKMFNQLFLGAAIGFMIVVILLVGVFVMIYLLGSKKEKLTIGPWIIHN